MATPLRSCRRCRTKRPKAELTRWVVVNGQPQADPAQRQPGRGFYICSECTIKTTKAR